MSKQPGGKKSIITKIGEAITSGGLIVVDGEESKEPEAERDTEKK